MDKNQHGAGRCVPVSDQKHCICSTECDEHCQSSKHGEGKCVSMERLNHVKQFLKGRIGYWKDRQASYTDATSETSKPIQSIIKALEIVLKELGIEGDG